MSQRGTRNKTRQSFLLTFFPNKKVRYEEKEVNGFILVKHIVNGNPNQHEVAIYTKDTFSRAQEYRRAQSHLQSIQLIPDED